MIYLNPEDLNKCLDLRVLQKSMKQALTSFSLKNAKSFPRTVFNIDDKSIAPLGFMPAVDQSGSVLGYKAIAVFHNNKTKGLNPHQGIVSLLCSDTGRVKCLLDGSFITAVRTAAVSAVATELLSKSTSSTLALIGAGTQAFEHIRAISLIRPIKTIQVYCRSKQTFDDLCHRFSPNLYHFVFKKSPREAVENADIVVTCTSANKSLLSVSDFPKGVHINAVGACRPGNKEVNLINHRLLKIYLDSEESCLLESEEIFHPLKEAFLSKEHIIGELGSCLLHQVPGRTNDDEITFFKSVGLSIEDLYAADFFYKKAQALGIGQRIKT